MSERKKKLTPAQRRVLEFLRNEPCTFGALVSLFRRDAITRVEMNGWIDVTRKGSHHAYDIEYGLTKAGRAALEAK